MFCTGHAMRRLLPGFLLATSALLLAFSATPAQAGTQEAPEISDAADDVTTEDGVPACIPQTPAPANHCPGASGFANLLSGWVASETASTIVLMIDSANNANLYGPAEYVFFFTIGSTQYAAGMRAEAATLPSGGGATSPTGVASAAAWNADTLIEITVPRAAIGAPPIGSKMTNLFLASNLTTDAVTYVDRAPNTSFGIDYTFGAGGPAVGDSDADGLEDDWERQYYSNLNQTGADDTDADGLNNTREQELGTDPTKADTDGDGFSDGEEDAAGTDPLDPASKPAGTPTPPTPPTPTTPVTPTTPTTPTTPSPVTPTVPPSPAPADDDDGIGSMQDVMDRIRENQDYFLVAAIAAVAVVLLALIALFGRWGV